MNNDTDKMIGKQILNYNVTKIIGTGGMASVYLAEHIKFKNKKVAIKVLNPILASNADIKTRFENEASIMAGLEHKHITQVIDFEDKKNSLAIIMEYLEGQDLTDYIKSKGKLALNEALNIFYQTLDAFAFAHQKGIVHRDVKPGNIFIQKNGNVKILDFGIAKILSGDANLTSTGTQMGTPMYMSPEQIRDSKEIDWRTDIYSLGVVLFYMLNGKAPYSDTETSSFDIQSKIVFEDFPTLENLPEINAIIAKATAKKPEERYQTCEEMMFELQNIEKTLNISSDQIIKTEQANNGIIPPIINSSPNKNEDVIIPQQEKNKLDKKKILMFSGIGAVALILLILIFSGAFSKKGALKFHTFAILNSDTILNQFFDDEQVAIDFFNTNLDEYKNSEIPGNYQFYVLRHNDNFTIKTFDFTIEEQTSTNYIVEIQIADNDNFTMHFNTLDEARNTIDSLIENEEKYYISFFEFDKISESKGDSLWSLIHGQDDVDDQVVAIDYTHHYQQPQNNDDKNKTNNDNGSNDNNQSKYDEEQILNNGFKAVKKNGLWAILDKSDIQLTDFKYLSIKSFGDGLLPVRKSDGWYYVNEQGYEINTVPFYSADVFQNQMAKVGQSINRETLYGFIDNTGNLAIKCKYSAATSFKRINGQLLSEVTEGTETFYINKSGRKIKL
ncbi:MAG: protein kinase [Bacteroidales bacterium]|nr:protein kinase [Bacteroidales bacterium]